MAETTELLSYALFLFLAYVYLPYNLFKFGAEHVVDIGRRRDFTQLEEIIAGFVPTLILHVQATALYLVGTRLLNDRYTIDFAVIASMFGNDRGAVSDYLYSGIWLGFLWYLAVIWAVSVVNGLWFGSAVKFVVDHDPTAMNGLSRVWDTGSSIPRRRWLFRWAGWKLWYRFFHESIVPLFAWSAKGPIVRVETTDHRIFYGRFVHYEQTTDGRLDAIRLSGVRRYRWEERPPQRVPAEVPSIIMGTLYLKWSQISDIAVMPEKGNPAQDEKLVTVVTPPPPMLHARDLVQAGGSTAEVSRPQARETSA